jgi:hypothetical protein
VNQLALIALSSVLLAAAEPEQRTFELTYVAELDVPDGAERVHMWLPYPRSDDYQDVRLLSIDSPVPTKLYQEYTYRNSMVFLSTPVADSDELRLEISVRVTRREHRESEYAELEDPDGWIESGASRWLRADGLVPLDESTRELAETLTEDKTSVVDKARAIFDYVVDEGQGESIEVIASFIGLARAAGIPAKLHVGFAIPSDRGEGEIGGVHGWSEFYVAGFGWVPVDVVEAHRRPDERDEFFGAHDANRVLVTTGSDITLNPKQSGRPLRYFINPYIEIDGKPVSDSGQNVRRRVFYKDLDGVAE